MKLQLQKTSKLFYNKWPYKIACHINGGNRLTFLGIESVRAWCTGSVSKDDMPFWMRNSKMLKEDKAQLLLFTVKVEPYLDLKKTKQGQIRAEGRHFNLFCRDKEMMEAISAALEPWVTDIYGPSTDEELEFMLVSDNKRITCDQLPYEKYQFRIYLKNDMPSDRRSKFVEWRKTYQDRVFVSGQTERWLLNSLTYQWMQSPFLYVEDAKTLTMVGLFLGGNVKKVEEFIPRSSINTILDQEQTCQP